MSRFTARPFAISFALTGRQLPN
uniref:Uncharacterized protein n=1 Tax=Anguilla anguilla TaxID=7936 RepID=A0A0E9TLC7_ANGAN